MKDQIQDEKLKELREDFNKLCQHHNDEMADIKKDVSSIREEMKGIKTDINWVKWLAQLAVGATITSILIGLVNLLGKG